MNNYFKQLISVSQLANLLVDATNVVLLDASIPVVTGNNEENVGWPEVSIVGAQRFDLKKVANQTSTLSYMMPTAIQFQQQVRELGINNDSQIVIYDNVGVYSAPRAWWMFKSMGFARVAVLNGGLPEWIAQQQETQAAELEREICIGDFDANFNERYFCDKESIKTLVSHSAGKIFDARGKKRFTGEFRDPRAGVRNGHIPTSFNLPYSQLQFNGKLLNKPQLQAQLDSVITAEDSVTFSCGSGITACILALSADICGYTNITVYDGSWSEWGSDATLPIATGEQ